MTPAKGEAGDRRRQILDAAAALFAEQGYYKTTTADVARAVGVTQPYVFHFFKSKEALYLAVLESAAERIKSAFAEVDAPAAELEGAMGQAFYGLLASGCRSEVLLCMTAHAISDPTIRNFVSEEFALIHRRIGERFRRAGLPDPEFKAISFIGMGLAIALAELLALQEQMLACMESSFEG
ncbi:TetR/AcrR family transcriptional regulator [Paenibacillus pasadenensis]|uniref:Transcriptional regulator, TetR family n=1 Tax=Paenibacillus pasadenensis TaxID=217090 RepID=A0A2N5NB21_9BACL|nr:MULTISPECIES: TetR/AcrR family transcriptional regulator [Paenibacillus]PLT47504.1 Transcriptional regulator, TetR family [Paenibacillus pasadenensis]QGG57748.1 TetR family transcriptional regulator [Paenibacillus sp. B01]